jgi:hypothetical protein
MALKYRGKRGEIVGLWAGVAMPHFSSWRFALEGRFRPFPKKFDTKPYSVALTSLIDKRKLPGNIKCPTF